MAHTKQTPRNPNLERPTAAMGSDIKESSYKRRETTLQTFIAWTH